MNRDIKRGHKATDDEVKCEKILDEICAVNYERSWWYISGLSILKEVGIDLRGNGPLPPHTYKDIFEATNCCTIYYSDAHQARNRTIDSLLKLFGKNT